MFVLAAPTAEVVQDLGARTVRERVLSCSTRTRTLFSVHEQGVEYSLWFEPWSKNTWRQHDVISLKPVVRAVRHIATPKTLFRGISIDICLYTHDTQTAVTT